MGKTTNFELNLVEGSQYVNPLTIDNPNYEKIDEVMKKNQDSSIQQATELVSGKIHAITCLVTGATFMRFTATGDFRIGDTFTYNGTPVTAFLPDGSGLSDYAYRINSEVLICVVGTRLTVYSYAAGSTTADNALALGGQPPEYYGRAADTIATYTQSKVGTVHNFVGNGSNGKVKIVSNFELGDVVQINGKTVSAFSGANDLVESFSGLNLVGKTLFFIYDSTGQIVNFNGGNGLSTADAAKLIPQNIRYGVKIFEGTSKEVVGAVKPIFCLAGWSGSSYWASDLNGNFYGPAQTTFNLPQTTTMVFASIKGDRPNDGIQIGDKVIRGEGNYIVTDFVGTSISLLVSGGGTVGTYFSIVALG